MPSSIGIEKIMQASPNRKAEVMEEPDHVTRLQDLFCSLMSEMTKA